VTKWLSILLTFGLCCGPAAGAAFVALVIRSQDEKADD
jgi:hypothetical protein